MEDLLFELLREYTYQPITVYLLVTLVMFLSSFGLPIPEEVSIISLGILSHIGANPDLYPPPYPDAPHVDVYMAMAVCVLSVFLSDLMVYTIGRSFGSAIFASDWFQRIVPEKKLNKIKFWARKWGSIVPGLFRLIPGVRFPGHMMCGALGISRVIFVAVDLVVIFLIIPTQIYLIYTFGETITGMIKNFQSVIGVIGVFVIVGLAWNLYKFFKT